MPNDRFRPKPKSPLVQYLITKWASPIRKKEDELPTCKTIKESPIQMKKNAPNTSKVSPCYSPELVESKKSKKKKLRRKLSVETVLKQTSSKVSDLVFTESPQKLYGHTSDSENNTGNNGKRPSKLNGNSSIECSQMQSEHFLARCRNAPVSSTSKRLKKDTSRISQKKIKVVQKEESLIHDKIISEIQKKSEELNQRMILKEKIKRLVSPTKPSFNDNSASSECSETKKTRTFRIIDTYKYKYYFSCFDDLHQEHVNHELGIGINFTLNASEVASRYAHLKYWHESVTCKIFSLSFLFHLMAIDDDFNVSKNCQEIILMISRTINPETVWIPSLTHIATVFLNYGITVEEHCPIPDIFIKVEEKLSNIHTSNKCVIFKENTPISLFPHTKVLNMRGLSLVFGLVEQLANFYKDEELASIVLLIFWLQLDPQFRPIHIQIQSCLLTCICHISETGWRTKWLIEMSVKLSGLSENAQEILNMCTLLAPVGRTGELRKVFSFSAAQKCLNVPQTSKVIIRPRDLVSLLKLHPLLDLLRDCRLLKTTIEHIDYVVGDHIRKKDKASLLELSDIMMSTYRNIEDSAYFEEQTQVKNHLIMIRCKWSNLISEKPSSKTKVQEVLYELPANSGHYISRVSNRKKLNRSFPDFDPGVSSHEINDVINWPIFTGTPQNFDQTLPNLHLGCDSLDSGNISSLQSQKLNDLINWPIYTGTPNKFDRTLPNLHPDLFKSPKIQEKVNSSKIPRKDDSSNSRKSPQIRKSPAEQKLFPHKVKQVKPRKALNFS